ncbi:UDP-N-acetylglucosamine transferase subunit ALG13 [Sinosporangium album]|uniref:UDP-N-acetylglucosamine transferase subunit ALG13 n=1 Tax=Sinosporangium album TaxID=504805 RepID=A0A1G7UEV8_9ACTN|nr:glycosyltransferase [Sinosporangium album]SDG45310.1 UDP-N-acetylglucosamine transferase subunit ALG13 [Sinosporangium album]
MAERPLVLVSVGTDHHPFERLMGWVERWLDARAGSVRCVVQHGTSRPPRGAECHDMLAHDELQTLMREADAVVCQGGPGGIMESRIAGRLPIVVPRTAALGEHVDDHQVRFTHVLATHGRIALAVTEPEFAAHLEKALADPEGYRAEHDESAAEATAVRFGELVRGVVARPRRGLLRR